MAQLADNHALLIYRVGPVFCCAPTLPVETLIPPPTLTRPPGSSDSHPGIFRHDGKLVRLTDLRQLFGVEQQDRTQPGRIAVCQLEGKYTGFLVDEIIDVIATPANGWGQISASLSGGVFTRSLLLNDRIHLYAEFSKLQEVRSFGFLKPWIQQLKEKILAEEKTPAQQINSSARMDKHTDTPPAEPEQPATESGPTVMTEVDTKSPPSPTPVTEPGRPLPSPTVTVHSQASIQQDKNDPAQAQVTNNAVKIDKPAVTKKPTTEKNLPRANIKSRNSPTSKRQQTPTARPPSTPADQPHPPPAPPHSLSPYDGKTALSTEENKAGTGRLLLMILLISGLITAFIYLWPAQKTESISTAMSRTPIIASLQEEPAISAPPVVVNESTSFAILDKKPDAETADTEPENTSGEKSRDSRYHASIEQQSNEKGGNEITIILLAPANDQLILTNPDMPMAQEQQPDMPPGAIPDTATSEHSANKNEEQSREQRNKTAAVQKITEILHTVVPGDTLWHIARRYIHNPFRYPELARLNKIRNPDLIYPGDRVRIILIQQSPAPVISN